MLPLYLTIAYGTTICSYLGVRYMHFEPHIINRLVVWILVVSTTVSVFGTLLHFFG